MFIKNTWSLEYAGSKDVPGNTKRGSHKAHNSITGKYDEKADDGTDHDLFAASDFFTAPAGKKPDHAAVNKGQERQGTDNT